MYTMKEYIPDQNKHTMSTNSGPTKNSRRKRYENRITVIEDDIYGYIGTMTGEGEGLSFPIPSDTWSCTIWVKFQDTNERQTIFKSGDLRIILQEGSLSIYTRDMSSGGNGIELFPNLWYNICIIFKTSYIGLFVDGIFSNSLLETPVLKDKLNVSFKGFIFKVKIGKEIPTNIDLLQEYDMTYMSVNTEYTTPFSVKVNWSHVTGVKLYKVKIVSCGNKKRDKKKTHTGCVSHEFYDLLPETEYIIRIYSVYKIYDNPLGKKRGKTLLCSMNTFTPSDKSSSYKIEKFDNGEGYDLTQFAEKRQREILKHASNKSRVKINIRGGSTICTICEDGELDLKNTNNIIIHSDTDLTESLGSSDSSVSYDDTLRTIKMGSVSYGHGESFLAKGMKVTIIEI